MLLFQIFSTPPRVYVYWTAVKKMLLTMNCALKKKKQLNCCFVCVRSVAQSCPTLCDPMECSRPDSTVHGIFQARIQRCFRQRQIWFHHLGSFESKIKPRKWVLMESPRWPVQKYLLESQDGCHDPNVVTADRFESQLSTWYLWAFLMPDAVGWLPWAPRVNILRFVASLPVLRELFGENLLLSVCPLFFSFWK